MKSLDPYVEFRSSETKIILNSPSGDKIYIKISAGSSFGAEHTTTRLCIRGIEEIFKNRIIRKVLDFGCGSGVLSLCAAALGATEVLGIDIDPIAVKESMINSEINKLNERVRVLNCSIEDVKGEFDIVIANIVTGELLKYSEKKSLLNKEGVLLVSGISELKKEIAISGFTGSGFQFHKEFVEDGWVALWFNLS